MAFAREVVVGTLRINPRRHLACLLCLASSCSNGPEVSETSVSEPASTSQQYTTDSADESEAREAHLTEPVVIVEDATKLSFAQMATNANKYVTEMQAALTQTTGLQAAARKDKDLVRLDCINEKLIEYNKLMSIVGLAKTDLLKAITIGDRNEAIHQYTKISISRERALQLMREAELCNGETQTYSGDTVIEVDIDGDIPEPGFGAEINVQPTCNWNGEAVTMFAAKWEAQPVGTPGVVVSLPAGTQGKNVKVLSALSPLVPREKDCSGGTPKLVAGPVTEVFVDLAVGAHCLRICVQGPTGYVTIGGASPPTTDFAPIQ